MCENVIEITSITELWMMIWKESFTICLIHKNGMAREEFQQINKQIGIQKGKECNMKNNQSVS